MEESKDMFTPPGHFYSPIPDILDIESRKSIIFNAVVRDIPGIDMNEDIQKIWFQNMVNLYKTLPFSETKSDTMRYYFENPAYLHNDAIMLYTFIRTLQPKNIIEVGSSFSSALMLDTVDRFLENKTQITFIEPFPETLHQILRPGDLKKHTHIHTSVQDVSLELFSSLKENDILFIDSTHVSKIGSDVNYLFFEVLPRLNQGVYVHIHDIFYPFEYPEPWVLNEKRFWNEAYLIRAFLIFNTEYEIIFFNDYFHRKYKKDIYKNTPLCLKTTGASLWIRKKKKNPA